MISRVIKSLRGHRFLLHNEKELQIAIHSTLMVDLPFGSIKREFILDDENIIDFLIDGEIGIEVKIKGQRRQIFRQCERYCSFDQIKKLLLVTNKSMGFPEQINGKDCYVINLGKAWL